MTAMAIPVMDHRSHGGRCHGGRSYAGGYALRSLSAKISFLILAASTCALSLPDNSPALHPRPGTGMFLLISDLHFDPYADPVILQKLGVTPTAACQAPATDAFANYGSDANYPLLKSALQHAATTAARNQFHYDYVIVTGDFLSHHFDERFQQCVAGGADAYTKFGADTVRFVDAAISEALPGVPIIAALGNNDSDKGDYIQPSDVFLKNVAEGWSRGWGKISAAERDEAVASFERTGNYAITNPAVRKNELVVLNSNLWATRDPQACGQGNPDPGGQFDWLAKVLEKVKRGGGTASLVMHIPPGVDALRAAMGRPRTLWDEGCAQELSELLGGYRGVVLQMYAGHIHRDEFRILSDPEGKPLLPIHIIPAISPVYLNNPAFEVGWYDRASGELRDYAALNLDLSKPRPAWTTEYVFTQAYGLPRADLAALKSLSATLGTGNLQAAVAKQYATYYGAGVGMFIAPGTWPDYSCAQTEIMLRDFAQCATTRANALSNP